MFVPVTNNNLKCTPFQGGPGICITNYFSRYVGHFNGFILSCRNFEEDMRSASIVAWLLHRFFQFQRRCIRHWIIDWRVKIIACSADIAVHRRWFIINVGSGYSCRCAVHQQQLLLVNVLLAPRLRLVTCISELGPKMAGRFSSAEFFIHDACLNVR